MTVLAVSALLPGPAAAGSVSGTATYRERIALPPDAVLEVRLEDVSRADAPSATLSMQRYALTGVPAEFALDYDDALIAETRSYVVRATILQEGRPMFTTDTAYPVLTRGGGNSADLVLARVSRTDPGLDWTGWQVVKLNGTVPASERPLEISFDSGGRFGAFGGCNRLSGVAVINGETITFPANMASTMMACPPGPDRIQSEFLSALAQVARYVLTGDTLALNAADGRTVVSLKRAP